MFASLSTIVCLAGWVVYVLAFHWLFPKLGGAVAPLAVLPVAATAWFFGRRAGLLAGVMAILLNLLLFGLLASQGWKITSRAIPSNVVFIAVGAMVGWFKTLLDQTRKQAAELVWEREILKEQIAKARSAEEALRDREEQLRQSQKMEAVGRLAGGIAHDFNNLLTAINGYGELALWHLEGNSLVRRDIEEIRKAGERAASLTSQLLAFSRKQVLQPRFLDVSGLVADTQRMLRRVIGEDIELITQLEPELGTVKADPGQLEQVIMNLAVNARDAMPNGGRLVLRTSNVVLGPGRSVTGPIGSCVMIEASDTGTGMDPETQSHIFEPFFTTKPKGSGTGLGLSTVYGIVKQSGGHVEVHSEPGKGTTFRVYLPRVDAKSQGAEIPDAGGLAHGEETILVVEDEDAVLDVACQVLEACGYTALKARGAEDAQGVCDRGAGSIHLMLTDVVMPNINGRELAQQLSVRWPKMKVLYMSGYTDDAILRCGLANLEVDFLAKPFSASALAQKVREVLDDENPSVGRAREMTCGSARGPAHTA